jgi:hypothetical protein
LSIDQAAPTHTFGKAHPPATRATYEDLALFCDQADAYLSDQSLPHPDLVLLVSGNPTQFQELVVDTETSQPLIRFRPAALTTTYGTRWAFPGGMLCVRALQLHGGGINIDHNGGGLSYVRMGGPLHANIDLGRILADTAPGEIAKQNPAAPFRVNDPAHFKAAGDAATRNVARGRPRRRPEAGREQAIANSLAYHAKNSAKTDIGLSAAEYEAVLRRCFAILDALHEARESPPRPQAA